MMTEADQRRAAEIAEYHRPGRVMTVLRDVSAATGFAVEDLVGCGRTRDLAYARQLAMFIARREGATLNQIARVLKRDHTTIMYGIRAEQARRGE